MKPLRGDFMRARPLIVSLTIAFLLLGATMSLASPTPSATVERKTLLRIPVEETDEELQLISVTFPPGSGSSPHLHPVQGMNYILEGTVESQYEGGPLEHYKAGDTYLDEKDRVHVIFRNTSSTAPLRFLIFCKIRKGVAFKQDLPLESPKR
jgi:quercetin dioxygenase-like cupin family protein